jgi:glycosyltransferase involved in cell wall biosynthesis
MNHTRKPVLGMVLKGYPRISETFISNEILLLEKAGYDIHIFSMRHPREPFCHESVKKIKAKVAYLPQTILEAFPDLMRHNIQLALKRPRRYGKAIRMAFKRFLRNRKIATIKHLLQAGYLAHALLPGRGVAHLHAHFAHSPTSVAMFASLLSGIDFSFTAHAKDIYTSNPEQLREKIALARFVVTCTEYNKRYLMKIAENGAKLISRIYHGIDVNLFAVKSAESMPSEPYQILSIARLVPKKGLSTVYRALQHLRRQGVDFRHILIGDGDEREKILSLIQDLGLTDVCRWLGTLPHESVLAHYEKSDLFVLGCKQAANGDRDGIPNVFIESMAMGVPVVGTRISAIPELIEDGRTGCLVLPDQPEKMAAAMLRLLTDSKLRNEIIPAARARVLQAFDNRKLIQDLVRVYRQGQPKLNQEGVQDFEDSRIQGFNN